MRGFHLRAAAESLLLLAKEANRFFDEAAPWASRKTDLGRCGSSLFVCCQYVRAFAGLWAMILPFSMQTLWESLGIEGRLAEVGWPTGENWLEEGHVVTKPPILFVKLDDELIEAEKERLAKLDPAG